MVAGEWLHEAQLGGKGEKAWFQLRNWTCIGDKEEPHGVCEAPCKNVVTKAITFFQLN
jgi:hypothetical protein